MMSRIWRTFFVRNIVLQVQLLTYINSKLFRSIADRKARINPNYGRKRCMRIQLKLFYLYYE